MKFYFVFRILFIINGIVLEKNTIYFRLVDYIKAPYWYDLMFSLELRLKIAFLDGRYNRHASIIENTTSDKPVTETLRTCISERILS